MSCPLQKLFRGSISQRPELPSAVRRGTGLPARPSNCVASPGLAAIFACLPRADALGYLLAAPSGAVRGDMLHPESPEVYGSCRTTAGRWLGLLRILRCMNCRSSKSNHFRKNFRAAEAALSCLEIRKCLRRRGLSGNDSGSASRLGAQNLLYAIVAFLRNHTRRKLLAFDDQLQFVGIQHFAI